MPLLPINLLEPGEIDIHQDEVDFSFQTKMIILTFVGLCMLFSSYITHIPKKDKLHEL